MSCRAYPSTIDGTLHKISCKKSIVINLLMDEINSTASLIAKLLVQLYTVAHVIIHII